MKSFLAGLLGDHSGRRAEPSALQFQAAFAAAQVGMVLTDANLPDTVITYVNPAFCQMTGYAAEELTGGSPEMLVGARTDAAVIGQLRQAVVEQRPAIAELECYRKDGRTIWMRYEVSPIFDGAKVAIGFIAICTDVTDSHRATQNLRDSEAHLRRIAEAIPLPVVIIDGKGMIREANGYAQAALQAADLQGRTLSEFIEGIDLVSQARDSCQIHQEEVRMRTGQGEPIWVLASTVGVSLLDDRAVIVVFVDIGSRKRREEDLARAKEEAERTTRAKTRFFAAASHDLRQPMQALALFTTALESHVNTPESRTILQSIKISLSNMEEMFDALLDMSRLDAGVLKGTPEIFMVNDVLERLEAEFAPQARRKGLGFKVVPSSAAVRTDPALLSRILRNFLSNALRYTQSGRILVGCKLHGGNLAILVADTGPGIAEGQRLAIFEEFYQTGGGGNGGLGLGLAIVQRLSRLLQHRLVLQSQPGHGSIFGVEVPVDVFPGGGGGQDEEALPVPDLAGVSLLVVDDDVGVREGLRVLFEEWGCQVAIARNGDEALQLVKGGARPDVILADPKIDKRHSGMHLINKLRDVLGPVPAFLFTADTKLREVPGETTTRILHKPLNPLKLRQVLAEALGRL